MISVLPRVEASPRSPTLVLPLRVSEHPRRHRERGGQGLPSSLFDCQRPRDITLDFIQSKPLEDACCESRLRTHDRCAHVRGRLRRVNISLICTNLSMRGRRREVASHDARRVSFSLRVCCYCANVSRDSVKRFYMNMLFVLIFCGRRCDYTEVSKRDGPRTRGRHVPGIPMIAMQTDDRDGRSPYSPMIVWLAMPVEPPQRRRCDLGCFGQGASAPRPQPSSSCAIFTHECTKPDGLCGRS